MRLINWLAVFRSRLCMQFSASRKSHRRVQRSGRLIEAVVEVQQLETRVLLSASPGEERFFGAIAAARQVNTHDFVLASSANVWFDSQTSDGNLNWILTGPTGIVATPSGGTAANSFSYGDQYLSLLPAGSYRVTVSGTGNSTGAYAFRLQDFAGATSLTLGTPVTATLTPANSTKLYQFSGTAGSTIFLDNTTFSTSDPFGYTGNWSLYDSYGREVGSWGLNIDSGRINLSTTGTYTLVVQGDINAISDPTNPSTTFVVRSVTDTTTALTPGNGCVEQHRECWSEQ